MDCNPHAITPTSPTLALARLHQHRGPVVIDLDETLYLRNSTEDFLDCAMPALPAVLLLRALEVLKPWRWTGGAATRDVWRVRVVSVLMPWTAGRWRRRVGELAARHGNRPLLTELGARADRPLVATLGFDPVVRPLLAALGLAQADCLAMSWRSFEDRQGGKLRLLERHLGAEALGAALVLTDSTDDLPVLARCGTPLLTRWPEARYRRALSSVYLPGLYLSLVKRPGERYFIRSIVQEDFALWVLSSIALATFPLAHVAGLFLLLLSFWAIYEAGYVDNDEVGARHEDKPKLSQAFHERPVATPRLQPWLWALPLGGAGAWLTHWQASLATVAWIATGWAAALAATWLTFWWYNRMDKATRVWLFVLLQLARSAIFLVAVPVVPVGAAAICAHALARWVPYQIYRHSPGKWPDVHAQTTRLLFLLVMAAVLGATAGWSTLMTASGAAILAWSLWRARKEIRQILADAHRIDRPTGFPAHLAAAGTADKSGCVDPRRA